MQGISKIESSEYAELNSVVRWFIAMRWIAAAGVVAALPIGRYIYKLQVPYTLLFTLTGVLVVVNLSFTFYSSTLGRSGLSRRQMAGFLHAQVCSDYVLLFLLLFFTGFFENPFVYYFVFHIFMTSFIFPRRTVFTYVLALVALFGCITVLEYLGILRHFPFDVSLNGPDRYSRLLPIRAFALTSTLVLTAYLVTSIKGRLEERGQRVELELDRYKSLDKTKSHFILQVTHELRGPVAAVKGYHEMILKGITGMIGDKTQKTLGRANRRTQNLLNIIDEMIDFAYMKSEEDIEYPEVELDAKVIVDEIVDVHHTFAKERELILTSKAPRELGFSANRDLVNIMLGNLITNALKYSVKGGTVTVSAAEEESEVHFRVKDEGIGIEPEELERIFEEFHRTRRAREVEGDGTGLGLSIVQRAVNILEGRITVYSEVGKGSSFHVYLPRRRNEPVREYRQGVIYGENKSAHYR